MNRCTRWFDRASDAISQQASSVYAVILSIATVTGWLVGGFFWGFSDTYQLVINTGTTIVNFVLGFLILHAQSRDTRAVHIKLDELIKSVKDARNEVAGIEKDPEALEKEDQQ